MGAKVKQKYGSVLSIDPEKLFNRLIPLVLVSSQDTNTDLDEILSYKLSLSPSSLFEGDDLMRKAHKPQITGLFKKHHTLPHLTMHPRSKEL